MNNYVVNTKNYNKRSASNSNDKTRLFDFEESSSTFEEKSSTFYDLHFRSVRFGDFNLEKSTISKLQRKMIEACKKL